MKFVSVASLGVPLALFLASVACSSEDEPAPSSSSSSGGQTNSSSGELTSSSGGSSGTTSSSSSSGSSGASSSSGGDAGVESLSAVVTDVVLSQADECELDLTVPGVDTPSDEADAKILAAIPLTAPAYCEADTEMTYDGGYQVLANEWGVLSISLGHSTYYAGAAHPNNFVLGHNFDIATGDELVLDTVLTAAGMAQLHAACVARLTDDEIGYEELQADETCTTSIEGYEGEGGGNFQIETSGVRLYLELSHAETAYAVEGVTLSWSELGANVASPLVQTFVSKQQD